MFSENNGEQINFLTRKTLNISTINVFCSIILGDESSEDERKSHVKSAFSY